MKKSDLDQSEAAFHNMSLGFVSVLFFTLFPSLPIKDPPRPSRPKAGLGLVIMMIMIIRSSDDDVGVHEHANDDDDVADNQFDLLTSAVDQQNLFTLLKHQKDEGD